MSFEWILPLLTLTAMEIILGIDNIIFIAIVVGKLPREQQGKARQLGLGLALGTRLLLLLALKFIMGLDKEVVLSLDGIPLPVEWFHDGEARLKALQVTWRDIILFVGGAFLIGKSTWEIHDKLEGAEEKPVVRAASQFGLILVQIALLDIVFSFDSVITAIGMARDLWVMVAAMIIAVGVMLVFAGPISNFVHRHPTLKILALSFLILIGVMLVAEAFEQHINRGYIYFAMVFSLVVELLTLRIRAAAPAVELHEPKPIPSE